MDQSGTRRGSRFSFSRTPQVEQNAASNMAKLKSQFRVQIQNVICPKKDEEGLDPTVKAQRIAEKLGITLDEEDLQIIKFDFHEYSQNYEEQEVLGEGCIGLVKSIRRKTDGLLFAVKIVKTSDEEIVKNMIIEFKNLQKLIHPNIVRMHEIYINYNDGFQSASTVCIVMEKIGGMEMFEAIQTMGHYSELMARSIFAQILEAIKFMHDNYCCHRDLKPNNILCSYDGKQVKITDFNVSKFSDQYKEFSHINEQGKIEMWTYTGTVAFSAPEVFSGGFYNEQVDMWSAGCILFTMLSGQLPFNADYLNELIEKISKGELDFSSEIWQNISDEAKDLISKLLLVDSSKRLKADDALQHSWIVGTQARKKDLLRDNLKKNINRLVANKQVNTPQQQVRRMRARCYLFGAGEVWKRHSMGITSGSLFDDFRKVKSFDIRSIDELGVRVSKDDDKKNTYKIEVPEFSDDDDEVKQ